MNDVFRKNIATVVSEQPDAYMPHVMKVLQGKLDELDAKFGAKLDRERRILETFLTVKVNEVAVRIIDQLIDDKMSGIENKIGELIDTKLAFSHDCPYRKAVDDVLPPESAWHLVDIVGLPAAETETVAVPVPEVAEAEPIITDEAPVPAAEAEHVVADEAPAAETETVAVPVPITEVAEAEPIVADETPVPAAETTVSVSVAEAEAIEAPPVSAPEARVAAQIAEATVPVAAPEATSPDPKRKPRTISSRIQRRSPNP